MFEKLYPDYFGKIRILLGEIVIGVWSNVDMPKSGAASNISIGGFAEWDSD